jgi:hypothetical protein
VLERAVADLRATRTTWARLPIPGGKIALLAEVRALAARHARDWVEAGSTMKGIDPGSATAGAEEWLGGPYATIAWLSDAIRTLAALAHGADPLEGIPVRARKDGQLVARVMPGSIWNRLLLNRYVLDVWMEPGLTREQLRETTAAFYRQVDPPGRLIAVLGAGNVSAIPLLDVLYCLVADGDVVRKFDKSSGRAAPRSSRSASRSAASRTVGRRHTRLLLAAVTAAHVECCLGSTVIAELCRRRRRDGRRICKVYCQGRSATDRGWTASRYRWSPSITLKGVTSRALRSAANHSRTETVGLRRAGLHRYSSTTEIDARLLTAAILFSSQCYTDRVAMAVVAKCLPQASASDDPGDLSPVLEDEPRGTASSDRRPGRLPMSCPGSGS